VFDRVFVQFPEQGEDYGTLVPGEASGYRQVELAYRYAYVDVLADGKSYVLQPFDYVGETPLGKGRFTYVLGLDPATSSVELQLVAE
jgi:hypothetical protein